MNRVDRLTEALEKEGLTDEQLLKEYFKGEMTYNRLLDFRNKLQRRETVIVRFLTPEERARYYEMKKQMGELGKQSDDQSGYQDHQLVDKEGKNDKSE